MEVWNQFLKEYRVAEDFSLRSEILIAEDEG